MRIIQRNPGFFVVKEGEHISGLIELQEDRRWKIELLQKFTHFESSLELACAWIRGVEAFASSLKAEFALAAGHRRHAAEFHRRGRHG